MLNLIVFTCGAALMALEMVAARVLAPFLGNSIYVWGAVISSVMVALSIGYWLGGQVADRFGAAKAFAPVIAAAGLFTMAAPVISRAVLPWAAGLGPRAGSLAASALIFFAPSLLMAMVTPLGIRLAASRGIERIGRSAGALSSISTAGSILGTIGTAFWLIPLLSLEPLIVAIGFTLIAAALASLRLPSLYRPEAPAGEYSGHLAWARGRLGAAACLVLIAPGAALGAWVLARVAPPPAYNELGERVLFRKDTQYHRLSVTEDAEVRHLRFDKSNQTGVELADPFTSRIRYPNYMHLTMALKPDPRRVLVLGLGGGAIPGRFWRDYPEVLVDSVEIDPVVVEVAERYFGLPKDPRLRVFTEDARRYVQTTKLAYDIVIFDCYYDNAVPFHLTTEEFMHEVKKRMSPDGVMAFNIIGSTAGPSSRLFRSMYLTASGVWDRLWVFPVGISEDGIAAAQRNIILLATDTDISPLELRTRVGSRVYGRVTVAGFDRFAEDLQEEAVPMENALRLTDAHAPVDSLISVR